eukprot:EG_transcript_6223
MSLADEDAASQLLTPDLFFSDVDVEMFSSCTLTSSSALAEDVQRSHFSAFFMPHHAISHPLPPKTSLTQTMRILTDGLNKVAQNSPWLRLQLHLKVRRTLRKRAQFLAAAAAQRAETLDSWLAYWEAEEGRIQQGFRQHLQSPAALQEMLRGPRGTVARCTTAVASALKVQVVWELYWILRAQHNHRLKLHEQRVQALIARRRDILQGRLQSGSNHSGVDFWQGEPQTLPAVTAALFVLSLQKPKFQYVAGQAIKATELLRLANAHLTDGAWGSPADSPLGPQSSPTLLAFLRSPLLTEPEWLKARTWQAQPLLPVLSWVPSADAVPGNVRTTRASYAGEHSLGSDSSAEASSSDGNFHFSDTELDDRMAHRTLTERRRSSSLGLRRPPREARQPPLAGGRPLHGGEGGGCCANSGDRPLLPAIGCRLPRPGRSDSGVIRRSVFSLQTPPPAYEQLFIKERAPPERRRPAVRSQALRRPPALRGPPLAARRPAPPMLNAGRRGPAARRRVICLFHLCMILIQYPTTQSALSFDPIDHPSGARVPGIWSNQCLLHIRTHRTTGRAGIPCASTYPRRRLYPIVPSPALETFRLVALCAPASSLWCDRFPSASLTSSSLHTVVYIDMYPTGGILTTRETLDPPI